VAVPGVSVRSAIVKELDHHFPLLVFCRPQ
jgi:hypothetical protein